MGDILFLAHRAPTAPDRGDRIRSYHLLRRLTELARVHVVAFDEAGDAPFRVPVGGRVEIVRRRKSRLRGVAEALGRGRSVSLAMFDSAALRRRVTAILAEEPIATIVAYSGQMAQFVPSDARARFVMDFVDVDSAKFAAYAVRSGAAMRWLYGREARLLGAFERATAARADASLFVSDAEAALFRHATGLGAERIRTIENGIDLDCFAPDADFEPLTAPPHPLIVFTGQMDYPPNIEAVARFAQDVLPAVRARHDATFAIVGRAPTAEVRALGQLPGVLVTGEVRDTRGWIAAADVVVAPLLLARGVQNKLLEAMAMARPAVATPAAFEGIDALPGRDLIVAELGDQAEAVCRLLDDRAAADAIGRNARARMVERYDWSARLAPIADLILPGSGEGR